MKVYINIFDDSGNEVGSGLLLDTDVVDRFGNIYTEEAVIDMLERMKADPHKPMLHLSAKEQ